MRGEQSLTPEARAREMFRGLSILDDASGVAILRYLTDQIRAVEQETENKIIERMCQDCICRLQHKKGCQCWDDE